MNELQNELLEMYQNIAKILNDNGIQFFVFYGTALGALRHNGFIPWDDDIDLLVKEEDLVHVNKVLSESLDPTKYYYNIPRADNHPHVIKMTENMVKDLKDKKTPFVDIFILEKYPVSRGRRLLTNSMIWGSIITITVLNRISCKLTYRLFWRLNKFFENKAKSLSRKSEEYVTIYTSNFKKEVFRREWFDSTIQKDFEGISIPLPSGIHESLVQIFGDYMTPPPESDRHGALGYPCCAHIDYEMDSRKV